MADEGPLLANDHGVDAMIVSKHGGHALVAAHLEVPSGVGGLRSCGDVVKALTLGPGAVLIGRRLLGPPPGRGAAGLS